MKVIVYVLLATFASQSDATAPWLDLLNDPNKQAEIDKRWHADGGQINLLFFYELLESHGIEVSGTGQYDKDNWTVNDFIMDIKPFSGIDLKVPYGNLIGADEGAFVLDGSFSWHKNGHLIEFKGLSLRAAEQAKSTGDVLAFELQNDLGQTLLRFDHVHALLDKDNEWLVLKNMDISITPTLAKLLGDDRLADLVIAQGHLQSQLTIPAEGYTDINDVRGANCAARPKWPGSGVNDPKADVALIAMSAQQQRNLNNGSIVVTPSATLKNVGGLDDADVAWYTKFSGTFPPYNNAQHPFLVWNMYREIDGRFEQIGVSGVKHAFLTINFSCTINCGNSHILWPGCEDVYGTGNNDSGSDLGPREFTNPNFANTEITANSGQWEEDCSFFDQDCSGGQENSSNSTNENRMVVQETDLGVNGAQYFVSAWYVIRDDINIYNSMGHRQYNLNKSGSTWFFSQVGGFENGPASDQYVAPDTIDLINNTASTRITRRNSGHLTVAVKVEDLGDGRYRYNYLVENHDYDPQVQTIQVPLPDGNPYTDFVFSDVDENGGNDWVVTHANDILTLQAPAGNEINWGTLYSFSFTSYAIPVAGDVTLTGLESPDATDFTASVIIPSLSDLIFVDGF